MKPEITLIEDQDFKGHFKGKFEINGVIYESRSVHKIEFWEKKFKIKKP